MRSSPRTFYHGNPPELEVGVARVDISSKNIRGIMVRVLKLAKRWRKRKRKGRRQSDVERSHHSSRNCGSMVTAVWKVSQVRFFTCMRDLFHRTDVIVRVRAEYDRSGHSLCRFQFSGSCWFFQGTLTGRCQVGNVQINALVKTRPSFAL